MISTKAYNAGKAIRNTTKHVTTKARTAAKAVGNNLAVAGKNTKFVVKSFWNGLKG